MSIKFEYLVTAIVFGVLLLLGVSKAAYAQNLPRGSYQDTCRNISVTSTGWLTADCETTRGTWTRTQLDTWWCDSEISNYDGALNCAMRSDAPPPAGSYQNSCVQIFFYNDHLSAWCRTEMGDWSPTSLDPSWCLTPIENIYGMLTCDEGDHPGPPGTYRMSCRKIKMYDGTLYASCQMRNRDWRESWLQGVARCNSDGIWNDNGTLKCNKKKKGITPLPPGVWWTVTCGCSNNYVEAAYTVDRCGYAGGGPAISLFACNYVQQAGGWPQSPGCTAIAPIERSQNTSVCTDGQSANLRQITP